jgi:uncharacterized protein (TIGR03437 family)
VRAANPVPRSGNPERVRAKRPAAATAAAGVDAPRSMRASEPQAAQLLFAAMVRTKPATCDFSAPPAGVSNFLTTDTQALLYFMVTGVQTTDLVTSEYYTPAGVLYGPVNTWAPVQPAGDYCFTDTPLLISGAPPAGLPGVWTVRVRINNVLAATLTFTIGSAACSYSLSSGSQSFGAAGGTGTVNVTAGAGCSWTASFNVSWITIQSGLTGAGNGTTTYSVAANTGTAARTGTITIGGQTLTVNQAGAGVQVPLYLMTRTKPVGCDLSNPPAAASNFLTTDPQAYLWFVIVGVQLGDVASTEYYTPSGQLYAPASDSFPASTLTGSVCFTDAPLLIAGTAAASQPGTWRVLGKLNGQQIFSLTFTIGAPACSYSLNATSQSFGAGGGTGSVSVTTTAGCSWTAVSNANWITIQSGTSGSGNGSVGFTVAANAATSTRSGTMTIAGQTFTVTQAAGSAARLVLSMMTRAKPASCDFSNPPQAVTNFLTTDTQAVLYFEISGTQVGDVASTEYYTPSGLLYAATSGDFPALTTGGDTCFNDSPLLIANAQPASLPGTWTVKIKYNTQLIATVTFTISAAQQCSYAISPASQTFGGGGGTGTVTVTTASGCSWTAASNVSWVAIQSGASGSGNGTVGFSAAANTTASARSGTMTIAGQTFTVNEGAPTVNIAPGSLAFSYTQGGSLPAHQSLNLSGPALSFTAGATTSWLLVSPTSGNTPATLDVSVNPQGLAPGAYQDTITVTSGGNSQTIAVSLAVSSPASGNVGGIIRTVAGNDWTFTIPGGLGKNAPLGTVKGMVTDAAGNIYVADIDNDVIVRWKLDGTAAVVAGNGIGGYSGDGGGAINASLSEPNDVTFDRSGNMYIADSNNNRIRKVTPDGNIGTIAGTGTSGFSGDGGPATAAALNYPTAVAVDSQGNVYLFDSGNYRIRKIGSDGNINTFAGNGTNQYSGEGAALQVGIAVYGQMAFDSKNNLYFGEHNAAYVRQISPSGTTSIIAGTGKVDFTGDGGPAAKAALRQPIGIAVDAQDNIYFGDFNNDRVRKITTDGIINTIAGTGVLNSTGDGGPALQATFNPYALAVDPAGNLAIADLNSRGIRRVNTSGIIDTVLGNHGYRTVADGTPAVNAYLLYPRGVAVDGKGGLIIADTTSQRVRRVAADGTFFTIAGTGVNGCCFDNQAATTALLEFPVSPAVDSAGNIYFVDSANHRIRKIGGDGNISTVVGAGDVFSGGAFDGDNGPALKAHLNSPQGMAFDRNGLLYIADTFNHVVRKVGADGTITTVAGTPGQSGFSGDGGQATSAKLNTPEGIAFDASNNLYIADFNNHSVRKVTPGGLITTFAGNQNKGFSGDGGPATQASMTEPASVIFDASGNAYILEDSGQRIRGVTPGGTITTVGGNGIAGFSGDGGPSTKATVRGPIGSMAMDAKGTLYFTDTINQRVRSISLGQGSAPSMSASPTSLTFSGFSHGSVAAPMAVSVNSSSFGLPFQVTTNTASGGNWLQTDVASGSSPATVNVTANPAGLAPGTYQGTVTLTSPYANPSTIAIAVTFNVKTASSGKLVVDSTALAFTATEGAAPATTHLSISNGGSDSIGFLVATATDNGGNWLSVSPANGTVASNAPVALTVTATPGTLPAGVYSGTITAKSPDTTDVIAIKVTMVISKAVPIIVLSQAGLTFGKVQDGGNPLPQTIAILNSGQGTMNWTATATALDGGNWLSLSQTSGTVARPFLDFSPVDVIIDGSNLKAGNYFGQIQVRAAGANNSPQSVSVVVNVLPPGSTLGPEVRPSGLVFIGTRNSAPGSQTVSIANRGNDTRKFTSTKGTLLNQDWFSSVPALGSVAANAPVHLTVQPDFSHRDPGIDYGVITLLFDGGATQTVNILSVVPPDGTSSSEGLRAGERAAGSCNPSKLAIQVLNPPLNSPHGQVNQPMSLEAQVADDCGNPITSSNGAVKVTFDPGEPAINMKYIAGGKWTNTWQPPSGSPSSIRATFTVLSTGSGGRPLLNQSDVMIAVDSGAPVPVVGPGGVLNGASLNATSLVAPGALITIKGNLLADGPALPNGTPVPTNLSNAEVRLGDQLLRLFYSSNNQINAQVPFALPVNTNLQLVVRHGDTISVPSDLSVAAAQPAIFATNQQGTGQGAILNGQTNVLADSGNPLHAGDVAAIYCTGLGTVNPPVAEGVQASTTVLSYTTSPVTVKIGGRDAVVNFAGLAPGGIGLYQVNAVVPDGVTGDAVEVTIAIAGQTSPPVTIAVR